MLNDATASYTANLPQCDRDLLRLLSDTTDAHLSLQPEGSPSASSPLDWDPMIERAAVLSVTPLLFDAIRHSRIKSEVPVEICRKLQGDYQVTALHNMLLYQKLYTILGRLQSHSIEVIPLKGIVLAQRVYQDIGLRPMSDIDLLIHPQDRAPVLRVMAELGFGTDRETNGEPLAHDLPQSALSVGNPTAGDTTNPLEERHHDRLTDVTGVFTLEIHWALVKFNSPFEIDYDALWQQATPATIAGIGVRLLSPVDSLLHLCIHLCYQHVVQHYTLRGLCDIQHLIASFGDRFDWDQFCHQTEQWRAQRSAHLALFLAHILLEVPVPPFVLQRLLPEHLDERLPRWAIERTLGYVEDSIGPWSNNTARWHLAKPWSQKARLFLQIIFPPSQQIVAPTQERGHIPHLWVALLRHWSRLVRSLLSHHPQPTGRVAHDKNVSWREREIGRTALATWLHEQSEDVA